MKKDSENKESKARGYFAGLGSLFQKRATARNHSGYTLIELLTVIGILAILSAIAAPNFISSLFEKRVSTAARDVLSAFEHARLSAVKDDNVVTLNFNYNSEQIALVNAGGTTIGEVRMPAGVDLQDLGLGASVQFNGRGQPSTYGVVAVVNSDNDSVRREIELMLGGNARIQR
jgi:prepilin-type N-terminal cleavage/methylation domain-containing protein